MVVLSGLRVRPRGRLPTGMVAIAFAELTSITVMTPPTSSVTNNRGPAGSGDSLAVPAAAPRSSVPGLDVQPASSAARRTKPNDARQKDGHMPHILLSPFKFPQGEPQ